MGRRTLYLTPEAKRDANRAKSKRSYYKHHVAINDRRRMQYQPKEKLIKSTITANINQPSQVTVANPVQDISYWIQRVKFIHNRIDKILDYKSSRHYVDMLYHDYMDTKNSVNIRKAVAEMRRYQEMMHRHQDSLLQLINPGSTEWECVDTVFQTVGSTIQRLEDLEAYTMMNRNEAKSHYAAF